MPRYRRQYGPSVDGDPGKSCHLAAQKRNFTVFQTRDVMAANQIFPALGRSIPQISFRRVLSLRRNDRSETPSHPAAYGTYALQRLSPTEISLADMFKANIVNPLGQKVPL